MEWLERTHRDIPTVIAADLNSRAGEAVVDFLVRGKVAPGPLFGDRDFGRFTASLTVRPSPYAPGTSLPNNLTAGPDGKMIVSGSLPTNGVSAVAPLPLLRHGTKLASAYDRKDLPFTNKTPDFEGSIDHILYTSGTLSIRDVLADFETAQAQTTVKKTSSGTETPKDNDDSSPSTSATATPTRNAPQLGSVLSVSLATEDTVVEAVGPKADEDVSDSVEIVDGQEDVVPLPAESSDYVKTAVSPEPIKIKRGPPALAIIDIDSTRRAISPTDGEDPTTPVTPVTPLDSMESPTTPVSGEADLEDSTTPTAAAGASMIAGLSSASTTPTAPSASKGGSNSTSGVQGYLSKVKSLPTEHIPSDHLPLIAWLKWKTVPVGTGPITAGSLGNGVGDRTRTRGGRRGGGGGGGNNNSNSNAAVAAAAAAAAVAMSGSLVGNGLANAFHASHLSSSILSTSAPVRTSAGSLMNGLPLSSASALSAAASGNGSSQFERPPLPGSPFAQQQQFTPQQQQQQAINFQMAMNQQHQQQQMAAALSVRGKGSRGSLSGGLHPLGMPGATPNGNGPAVGILGTSPMLPRSGAMPITPRK
jgi:hypothetical protein